MARHIHTILNCLGFFGFGGGYRMAELGPERAGASICNSCPVNQECWEKHKARVAEMFPTITAAFERVAAMHAGDVKAMMQTWQQVSGGATDPYVNVMGGNMEDGMAVRLIGAPKDRGSYSLPWPFMTH